MAGIPDRANRVAIPPRLPLARRKRGGRLTTVYNLTGGISSPTMLLDSARWRNAVTIGKLIDRAMQLEAHCHKCGRFALRNPARLRLPPRGAFASLGRAFPMRAVWITPNECATAFRGSLAAAVTSLSLAMATLLGPGATNQACLHAMTWGMRKR